MLKNYVKLIFRNLWKNKTTSIINLTGLTIGIGCSLLLLMYVTFERSYDINVVNGDDVYRLLNRETSSNGRTIALSENEDYIDLSSNYPQIKDNVKIRDFSYNMYPQGELKKEVNVDFLFASPNFFEFFNLPIITGNLSSVLADPSSIVITEELAMKLFGRTDVVGETITVDATFYMTYQKDLIVTGVTEKVENSHIQFEAVIPWDMANTEGIKIADSFFGSLYNYVRVNAGSNVDDIAVDMNLKLQEKDPNADYVNLFQPLSDIYFGSNDISFSSFESGNLQTVNTLFYVALVILLIACINYINLQTAKSSKRSLEVGVKKVLGAKRSGLVWQFMTESLLITFIAACFSILLIDLVLPAFNNLTDKNFTMQSLLDNGLASAFVIIYLSTAFLSGAYPAFVLSSFKPSSVLNSISASSPRHRRMRSGLMLIQFGVSICLLAITYLINQQTTFISEKELGFNKDQVITFDITEKNIQNRIAPFRKELDQYSGVNATTVGTDFLGRGFTNISGSVYVKNSPGQQTAADVFDIDHSFVDTYELKVISGRDFDLKLAADSNAILVNEKLISALSIQDPLTSSIALYRPDGIPYKIIGVLEDFHVQGLQQEINPTFLRIASSNIWQMSVRISPSNMEATLGFIDAKWNEFEPGAPFKYEFVDEHFARFYAEERRMLKAITFFSTISVILTILGLFAMTVFSIEQKMKEIGIRKVLGANGVHVFKLIYQDFLTMLVLAIIIATPVIYYLGNNWLDRFAYRVDLTAMPIALASLVTFLVISLIVSGLTRKASNANPVNILRSE